MRRTKTKTLTTAEAAQAVREMPDWQKQRLGQVLIKIAINHGWLKTGQQFVPPSAGAGAESGPQF